MVKIGLRKDKKSEAPTQSSKSVVYVMSNVGSGPGCEYADKVNELAHTTVVGKDGKSADMSVGDACTKAFEALGLPSGISYHVEGRRLFIDQQARNQIESNPELNKKFRKTLGIDEKQELKFEKYL